MMANAVVLAPGQYEMASARMRIVVSRPDEGLLGWLVFWTGKKTVPEPSLWEDSICRPGEMAQASRRSVRAGMDLPLAGGLLR